jgi:hypothetical protein
LKSDFGTNEAQKELTVRVLVSNELAVSLKVCAFARHQTVATSWVLREEDEVKECIVSPWNILVGAELTILKVDVAVATSIVKVDLWVHGKMCNPLAISWNCDTFLSLEESTEVSASTVEEVSISRDESPGTVRLWADLPSAVAINRISAATNFTVAITKEILALVGLEGNLASVGGFKSENLLLTKSRTTAVESITERLNSEVLSSGHVAKTKSPGNRSHDVDLCDKVMSLIKLHWY